MSEVDAARRARERGDRRTWRERALDAEARLREVEAERDALKHGLWGSSAATITALTHRAEKAEAELASMKAAWHGEEARR